MSNETELSHASSSNATAAPAAAAPDNDKIHRGVFVPIAAKGEHEIYTLAGIRNLVIDTIKGAGSTVHFKVTFDVNGAKFQNDRITGDKVKEDCLPGVGNQGHVFLGFSDANGTTIGQHQQVGVTARIGNQNKAVLNVEVTMSSGKVNGAAGGDF
jgi:hypothetical protein